MWTQEGLGKIVGLRAPRLPASQGGWQLQRVAHRQQLAATEARDAEQAGGLCDLAGLVHEILLALVNVSLAIIN